MHAYLTPLPIGNHSVFPYSVLTVASCPWYRLCFRMIKGWATPISFRATQNYGETFLAQPHSCTQRTFPKGAMFRDQKVRIFTSQPKIWSSKQASTAQYRTWSLKVSPKNYLKLDLEKKQYSENFSKS